MDTTCVCVSCCCEVLHLEGKKERIELGIYKETEAGYAGKRGGDRDTGEREVIKVSNHNNGDNLQQILQERDHNHWCGYVAHYL